MLIIGTLFMLKSDVVRTRMRNELKNLLDDNIHCPVVAAEELRELYTLKRPNIVRMGLWFLLTVAIIALVILFQENIMRVILSKNVLSIKVLIVFGIMILTPLFAIAYGTVIHYILKWLRLD
jgi:hypothetical protein